MSAPVAEKTKSTYPASFMLPLSDELRSIDGWLEIDPERVAFRNGHGLELQMRIDRVAGISLPELPSEDQGADDRGTSRGGSEASLPDEEVSLADYKPDELGEQLGVMHLAGECGPAHVDWELLIKPADAHTLGEELSAALGGTYLRTAGLNPNPEVITLERTGEVGQDVRPEAVPVAEHGHTHPRVGLSDRVLAWRPGRRDLQSYRARARAERRASADPERRALLIRRRRIAAMVLAAAVLVVAIELTVTLLIIPG